MRILLISTYELGRQPFHLAAPTAALREVGHDVRAVDLSVEGLQTAELHWAEAVAFSVPMHTAMRLALSAAGQVRRHSPDLPICFYGLYANAGALPWGASAITGEYLDALVEWAARPAIPLVRFDLSRSKSPVPDRSLLPPLDRYAHLEVGGEMRRAGATEASSGCRHRCTHCPVPVVYDGKYRIVDVEAVVADVDHQVAQGATHITFGDPDFLNGSAHSRRVLEAIHARHPLLTFDITVKVEHIIRHEDLWPVFAHLGVIFVVSAFETTNDQTLRILRKGHRRADMGRAVDIVRSAGIDLRPTWLPFTPWTTVEDLNDIVDFLDSYDLEVDPIQLTIRLLVPPGSLLLTMPEMAPYLGELDGRSLGFRWTAEHSETDELHRRLTELLESDVSPSELTELLITEIRLAAGVADRIPVGATEGRPRLTEPWFC